MARSRTARRPDTFRPDLYRGLHRRPPGGCLHLTRSSIRTDRDTGVRYLHLEEKTGAGVRDVPIHSAIEGTIDRLAEAATSDGYLLHLDSNRYEKRGDAIGKRF